MFLPIKHFFYVMGGDIPYIGVIPLFLFLLFAIVTWVFMAKKSERHSREQTIKIAIYIFLVWLVIYVVLIAIFPASPMPVRLAVYPLAGPNTPLGMGNQIALELEEGIASTHPRWCIGAFRRTGMKTPPSASLSPTMTRVAKQIKLDWIVCGEWKSETNDISNVDLRLKLVYNGSHDTLHINVSGETGEAIRLAATKIAKLAHLIGRKDATIAPLTPTWRITCARTQVVSTYDSTQKAMWHAALISDPKSLGGVTTMIAYFVNHPGADTLLYHIVPTVKQLVKIGDRYIPFLITIGAWHRSRGENKEAADSWMRANILSPVRPELHYFFGFLDSSLVYTKYETTPNSHFVRALELDPGYAEARMALLMALPVNSIQHRYKNLVEDGLKIDSNSVPLLSRRAYYQIILGENEEGLKTVNRILAGDPDNPDAIYNRGIAYIQNRDTANAKRDFLRSYSLHGTVENLYYLATIHEGRAEWDSALYYYEKRYVMGRYSTDPLATEHARIRMLKIMDEHKSILVPNKTKPR